VFSVLTTRIAMLQGSQPTRGAKRTDSAGARWSVTSSALGALLWLAAPLSPLGLPPSFGSMEHLFVFMPLVAAPLAILLLSALLDADGATQPPAHRVAQRVQPVAAALVLASFFFPKGALAGGLTAGWSVMTILLAVAGVRRRVPRADAQLSHLSLVAAQLFLPVGAGWLLLSRLGVGPRNFAELTVFLAALHFHFSGFTLQILIAATGRRLQEFPSRLAGLHRYVAFGAIAGIPLIAAGNISSSPVLKFGGVACMVLSTLGLAATSAAVALNTFARPPRGLLLMSAISIAAGMVLAGAYGIGELTGAGWIGIPRMVALHGLLNALGFTLCGLIGHLVLSLRARQPV
jgi:hypothetical protein